MVRHGLLLGYLHGAILLAPFVAYGYYLVATLCARRFFRAEPAKATGFVPAISVLKAVRGLDREAYENFASLCRLDYPDYEIIFGVCDPHDPVIPVIQKLMADFPDRAIRLFTGLTCLGANEKASILAQLVREARHDILVISDSDTRIHRDGLRVVAAPFRDPEVGAVTCVYRGIMAKTPVDAMEALRISADFLPSVLVARLFGGTRFALGATVATTKQRVAEIGGFEALAGFLLDDFELGRLISARGYRVDLLPYVVPIVLPGESLQGFWQRQVRWLVGIRHCRPWGHLGLLFTQGLPLSLLAIALSRSGREMASFAVLYLITRYFMAFSCAGWGLEDSTLKRKWWLTPAVDAATFFAWVASMTTDRVRWRGSTFHVRKGRLRPENAPSRE
jgi:ceramide glucosyltransferase